MRTHCIRKKGTLNFFYGNTVDFLIFHIFPRKKKAFLFGCFKNEFINIINHYLKNSES